MPQFKPVPRTTPSSSAARQRRVAGSFQIPGGEGQVLDNYLYAINTAEVEVRVPVQLVHIETLNQSWTEVNLPQATTPFYHEHTLTITKGNDFSGSGFVTVQPNFAAGDNIEGSIAYFIRPGMSSITLLATSDHQWRIVSSSDAPPIERFVHPIGNSTLVSPVQQVLVDVTANTKITLPPPVQYIGIPLQIKRSNDNAFSLTLEVNNTTTESVEGLNTFVVSNARGAVSLMSDGNVDWYINSVYP